MQVKYIPAVDANGSKINEFACAILLPDGYPGTTKWKWAMFVHGMGELSQGGLANLKNLVEGFDYNNDGIREGGFVTEGMKWAVDAHQLIIVVPTYSGFFEPEKVDKIYDYMLANYNVQPTFMHTGFSLGGGCVFKYASSSITRAKRVHLAVPCAGTYGLVDAGIAAKNGTVWHAFANDGDNRVPASNTINQIDKINAQNPAVKAVYTIFHRDVPGSDNHGSNTEAWDKVPPKAPGGQGLIDAAETIYQLNDAILASGPRQMKSGTVPIPSPTPTPPTTVAPTAAFNLTEGQVITTTIFEMDASASTGVGDRWDAYKWDVRAIVAPTGKSYGVRPESSAYGGPKKRLIDIVDGQYEIVLTVKDKMGNTASKKVNVTAKIGTKTISAFDSATDLITYSDGTTEKGIAVLSGGKWTIKNLSGQTIL